MYFIKEIRNLIQLFICNLITVFYCIYTNKNISMMSLTSVTSSILLKVILKYNSLIVVFLRTIASKINVTPKGVHMPISKLQSIFAAANLLAHNNISQICYCGQILLQSAATNSSFSDNLTTFVVTFILLAMWWYIFLQFH